MLGGAAQNHIGCGINADSQLPTPKPGTALPEHVLSEVAAHVCVIT